MNISKELCKQILEAALFAAGEPVAIERLQQLFSEEEKPSLQEIREIFEEIKIDNENRGLLLHEVASGFCFQVKTELQPWIGKLWEKRPPRYSRAFMETLSLIAYRQPITRAEIEDIRGVSVSSHIFKLLMEREWVRIVGHKDVPGKPALYATTKQFLDYFNLKSLEELPPLTDLEATLKLIEQQEKAPENIPALANTELENLHSDNLLTDSQALNELSSEETLISESEPELNLEPEFNSNENNVNMTEEKILMEYTEYEEILEENKNQTEAEKNKIEQNENPQSTAELSSENNLSTEESVA